MGESQSLSNFFEGGVAPTELPVTTPKAQRKRPPVLPKAAYGTGHSPSLILNHNPSMIMTTLSGRRAVIIDHLRAMPRGTRGAEIHSQTRDSTGISREVVSSLLEGRMMPQPGSALHPEDRSARIPTTRRGGAGPGENSSLNPTRQPARRP